VVNFPIKIAEKPQIYKDFLKKRGKNVFELEPEATSSGLKKVI
jgi:hypothetical protein